MGRFGRFWTRLNGGENKTGVMTKLTSDNTLVNVQLGSQLIGIFAQLIGSVAGSIITVRVANQMWGKKE